MSPELWLIAALSVVALLVGLLLLWRGGRPPTMDERERAFYRELRERERRAK